MTSRIFVFLFFALVHSSYAANARADLPFGGAYSSCQIVAYVTDLEGSRIRFQEFISQSQAFLLGADNRYHLRSGACFVFGGDAVDRYLGSRWVLRELLRLKNESPDRVVFILGNRDINKMRLTTELSPEALRQPPVRFHFTKDEEWQKHGGPELASERLKYIFTSTMGAPSAFELYRKELAEERHVLINDVTDQQVAEAYVQELGPNGLMRLFLEQGQLSHRIGNTLFVHGGLTEQNLLFTLNSEPGFSLPFLMDSLNAWMRMGVETWRKQGQNWNGLDERVEQPWLEYPMPDVGFNSKPTSLVTGRNFDLFNNPLLPTARVIQWLSSFGIQRLVIGHTPTTDFGMILRTKDEKFEVVLGDNSYAKEEFFVSLIHFFGPDLARTEMRGMLTTSGDGAVSVIAETTLGEFTLFGKRYRGGVLVGRPKEDPESVLSFRFGEKFRTHSVRIPKASIETSQLEEARGDCEGILKP